MINDNDPFDQLPNEIKFGFKQLNVPKHLNAARFKKKFGFTCAYLYRLVYTLLFHQKNWFCLLESSKGETFPGKDAVYRFLNHPSFSSSVLTALILCVVAYFVGDQIILRLSNNTIAAIADVGLAFVYLWIVADMMDWALTLGEEDNNGRRIA